MLIHPEVMGVEALADKIRKIENWPQKGFCFMTLLPFCKAQNISACWSIYWFTAIWGKSWCRCGLGCARLHHWRSFGLSAERRLCPHPQKRQTAVWYGFSKLRFGIWRSNGKIHTDAIKPGARVLLVDDLVATGGTMLAGVELIRKLGGEVIEVFRSPAIIYWEAAKKNPWKRRAVIYPYAKTKAVVDKTAS